MNNPHLTPRETPISPGEIAPDFTLKDQDRNEWRLSDALSRGGVVLCFYPMDFTGVCGTEMRCVTDELARWKDAGYEVVGVSCDSFAVHKAWAEQMGLEQTLLADMHRDVCRGYGLYWPELNIARRGTVVIRPEARSEGETVGVVTWVQGREPGQAMNFDEVLSHLG
ncbi:MAG: redoxin domain-containing protein [Phycisphaeraceae bacterium]|nr:redoxin domain-containing protein [Phycisphaeraceae bacterium]